MTSSLTVAFSGKSPVLQAYFSPEIILDNEYTYSCALLDLMIKDIKNEELDGLLNSKIDEKNADNQIISSTVVPNVLHIECDIISGSYINGQRSHTIHQFATSTSHVKGQIFVEIPEHLNYFPVKIKNLRSIQISILDINGAPLKIEKSDIVCRINIKRDNN